MTLNSLCVFVIYKIGDFIESMDLEEFESLQIPGISPASILESMIKRGIL